MLFVFAGKGGQLEVFGNCQVLEQAPSLRDMGNSKPADDFIGRIIQQVIVGKDHLRAVFYRHHSLASNHARANQGVSRYAIRNDAAGAGIGFPHGLEIQIVGSAAARKVLVHMTIVSTNMAGLKAYYDTQVIVRVREG